MSDAPTDSKQGRPERSGRPTPIVSVDPLAEPGEADREIDLMTKRSRYRRNERWENARQALVLGALVVITIVLVVGFVWAVSVLIPTDPAVRRETAQWIVETEVGGLIAGLIGLWAVKSFEK